MFEKFKKDFFHEFQVTLLVYKHFKIYFLKIILWHFRKELINCYASFRLHFGLSLRKHFPFSIHGNCRSYFNFRKSGLDLNYSMYSIYQKIYEVISSMFNLNYTTKTECARNSICELKQLNENKFYLSFESKNCTDYITEKLWSILHAKMIPIVIQPAKKYYEYILPSDS